MTGDGSKAPAPSVAAPLKNVRRVFFIGISPLL
jgi:hypothetical protein